MLTSVLGPGEVFRNTAPAQVLAFSIDRAVGNTYTGPVRFDVTLTMLERVAIFSVDANLAIGSHRIDFLSARRAVSVPTATPASSTTWGRLKSIMRGRR